MAAPIVPAMTTGLANFLQPRWYRVLADVGSEIEELYTHIFNVDSDVPWNPMQEAQFAGLSTLRPKPQGQGFGYDSIIEGGSITYESNPWGLGFRWTIEMMRFDLYGLFERISTDLLRAAPHRVELEAWAVFNDAFDGNLFRGFDALPLCHTAHPYIDPLLGTFSNRSPTNIALSQSGVQEALLHFALLQDMRGMPNYRRPALAICSAHRIMAAREIFQSVYEPTSPDNAINTIVDDQIKYFAPRGYLTSQSAWWLISRPSNGDMQRGHDLWVKFAIPPLPDQFEDRHTKSSVQTMYENFSVHFGSPFGVWGSSGA